MRLRLAKVDEYQALTCLKHSIWGSHKARFKDWQEGDYLAIIVNKSLAALAVVSGKPFVSSAKIWDNGLYPNRIPLKFQYYALHDNRKPILGPVRDALTAEWSPKYGWGILNQRLLEGEPASIIVNCFKAGANDLKKIEADLADLLMNAKSKRDSIQKKPAGRPSKKKTAVDAIVQERSVDTKDDDSRHAQAQLNIVKLGQITGCSVWLAANDQNKSVKGNRLADGCLKSLPRMGLSDEAKKRISLIDVIWLSQNAPISAFEVETTTSVYSGMLRMADLLAEVPSLKINLYIVAPKERRDKVMRELQRPTFRKIGLNEYCRYIASEDLADLISKAADLSGHLQPSVIDKIAEELNDDEFEE